MQYSFTIFRDGIKLRLMEQQYEIHILEAGDSRNRKDMQDTPDDRNHDQVNESCVTTQFQNISNEQLKDQTHYVSENGSQTVMECTCLCISLSYNRISSRTIAALILAFVITVVSLVVCIIHNSSDMTHDDIMVKVNATKEMSFVVGVTDAYNVLHENDLSTPVCKVNWPKLEDVMSSEVIQHLYWSGQIRFNAIVSKLLQSRMVTYVYLENSACGSGSSKNSMSQTTFKETNYNRRDLTLRSFSPVQHILVEFIIANRNVPLRALHIENTELHPNTTSNLLLLVAKNKYSIESLSVPATALSHFLNSSSIQTFPQLQKLRLVSSSPKFEINEFGLDSDFCMKFPRLREFNMTSGSLRLNDIQKLLKCENIEFLSINIKVPQVVLFIKISDILKNAPISLIQVQVNFYFNVGIGTECGKVEDTDSKFKYLSVQSNCY